MARSATSSPQSLALRPAIAQDSAILAKLDAGLSFTPWSEQRFADCCYDRPGNTLCRAEVLVLGGRLIGFAVYQCVLDEATLMNIGVEADSQQHGFGARLLQRGLQRMQSQGARRCLLEVRASNLAATRLYQKFNFTVDGHRKDYYQTAEGREDALLMSCPLAPPTGE